MARITDWFAKQILGSDQALKFIDDHMPRKNFFLSGEIRPGTIATLSAYTDYTQQELARLCVSNYAVWRNITLISRMVSSGTMIIQKKAPGTSELWEDVEEHEFEQIIEGSPNAHMGQTEIWETQVIWYYLTGEAYWLKILNSRDETVQLFPMPSFSVVPVPDEKEFISGYLYTPKANADKVFIPKDRIIYHKSPNPFNIHRGLAPVTAFGKSMSISREALEHDLDNFIKRLQMEHIVSVPEETTDMDFEQIRYDLKESQQANERFLLMRGGDMRASKVEKQEDSNPDLKYKITESQINSVLGVNDATWQETANRATAEVRKADLIENTIWPLMMRFAEDFTVQHIKPVYGSEFRAYWEDIRPANIERDIMVRDDERKDQTYGEARIAAGLDPHSDDRVNDAPYAIAGEVYRMIMEAELTGVIGGGIAGPEGIDPENVADPELIPVDTVEDLEESGEDVPGVGETETAVEGEAMRSHPLVAKAEFVFTDDMPDELRDYGDDIEDLMQQAEDGEISRENFRKAMIALIGATYTAMLLFGAGADNEDDIEGEGIAEKNDQAAKAEESIDDLYAAAAAGVFGGDEPTHDKASRIALWLSAAAGVIAAGLTYSVLQPEPWLRWDLGNTEKHCSDCLGFNGQIKKASEWRSVGKPQSKALECGGWNCDCRFTKVPKPEGKHANVNGTGERVRA